MEVNEVGSHFCLELGDLTSFQPIIVRKDSEREFDQLCGIEGVEESGN